MFFPNRIPIEGAPNMIVYWTFMKSHFLKMIENKNIKIRCATLAHMTVQIMNRALPCFSD